MLTFAGQYGAEKLTDSRSRILARQPVDVYLVGTSTRADLYTSRLKAAAAANPVSTDRSGNVTFFADPGQYDLHYGGVTVTVMVPVDPADVADQVSMAALDGRLDVVESTMATDAEVTAAVDAAVTALVASAPGVLNTLDELAAALGDDANFATTMTTALAGKAAAVDLTAEAAARAAADAAHAAHADPHPDYLTEAAASSAYEAFVNHGLNAATARPAGATHVHWTGSVAPTNAVADDEWFDRLNNALKRYTGRAWITAHDVETRRLANTGLYDRTRLTLVGGQVDETVTVGGTGSPSSAADTVNFKLNGRAHKFIMGGAGTGQFFVNPAAAVVPPPAAAVGMEVYIPSLAGLSQVTVNIYSGANMWQGTLNAASFPAMAVGKNVIRFAAADSILTGLAAITSVRFLVVSTGALDVSMCELWLECPRKAQLVLTADGVYGSAFATSQPITAPGYSLAASGYGGYADFAARGLPVVLAPDTDLCGSGAAPSDRASWATIRSLMADGNGNELNYHGSTGAATSGMSATQIVVECMKAIKEIQRQGFRPPLIKAGWTQNSAPQAAAVAGLHLGMVTSTNLSGSPVQCWPPKKMTDIPRFALHGVTTAAMDTAFANLQTTRGFMNAYLHGVDPVGTGGGNAHMTPAEWAYFLGKVDAAIAAGWLEVVTFDQLLARGGVKQRYTAGDQHTDYVTAAGVAVEARLP